MKTAICFSGAIRDFNYCISSIYKYFLNNMGDYDIYLHLWTFNNDNNIQYSFKWRKDNIDIDNLLQILKPKNYIINEYSKEYEEFIIKESNIDISKIDNNYGFNCCSMYWKIKQCFELVKQSNINYDLIIRARLDFIWENHIYINDFDKTWNIHQ